MTLEFSIGAALLGAAASVLAVFVRTIGEKLLLRLSKFEITRVSEIELSAERDRDNKLDLSPAYERLLEARLALSRQQAAAQTNRWMSGLLTIGQYIVGGLLASSFVQQSLSRELVGGLGLLVLVSSLLYQHFRPDIRLRGALGRALRLEALIREAEDDLFAMRTEDKAAPTIFAFRKKISQALSDIANSELQDVTAQMGHKSHEK